MEQTFIIRYLKNLADTMIENRSYLIELDNVVGDGDLGLTMSDGFLAAYDAARNSNETDLGKLLYAAGKAMATAVPSTMGTLMASGFMEAGKRFKGEKTTDDFSIVALLNYFAAGVMMLGKAKPGEKTFLDAFLPAIDALQKSLNEGENYGQAVLEAMRGAELGFRNTTSMVAVHGRAAIRGKASQGMQDPGAAVAVLMVGALSKTVGENK